ncbi:MAG: HK97 gp10 family phage protein [Burkholderiales bacterium]|jgi:HK97 gp10 family phage protein|nr:HK97 gp10 family phage protein [Burkholderiales bacterium]
MARKLIDITHNVQGLAELEKGLRDLGRDVGLMGLSKASSSGARVIRDAARANVPVDSGKLKQNIVVTKYKRIRDKTTEARYAVVVRAKGKAKDPANAYYGYFVEHGHKTYKGTHTKKGNLLSGRRRLSKAEKLEYGTSEVAAQPFMRPAAFAKRQDAVNTAITSMEKTIADEKAKKGFK